MIYLPPPGYFTPPPPAYYILHKFPTPLHIGTSRLFGTVEYMKNYFLLFFLVARHFSLFAQYFLLVSLLFLIATRYFLPLTCYSQLVVHYVRFLIPVPCYILFVACYFQLVNRYFPFIFPLFVTFWSLSLLTVLSFLGYASFLIDIRSSSTVVFYLTFLLIFYFS